MTAQPATGPEAHDAPTLAAVAQPSRRFAPSLRRTVALTTLVIVGLFLAMLGLAAFHGALAKGQFELDRLDAEIESQRAEAGELRLLRERLEAPDRVRREAIGYLGMVDAPERIQLQASPETVAAVLLAVADQTDR